MKHASARSTLFAALVLCVSLPSTSWKSHPQQQPQPRPGGRSGNPVGAMKDDEVKRQERESIYNELKTRPARASEREQRLRVEQASEDFTRIQVIADELTGAAAKSQSPDPDWTARRAEELGRRAGRLKGYLTLPALDGAEMRRVKEAAAEEGDLKTLLARLGASVKSFASNPYLRDPRVVDARRPFDARRDLELVVALSLRVKKLAEESDAPKPR
jgi:hypothetical protein